MDTPETLERKKAAAYDNAQLQKDEASAADRVAAAELRADKALGQAEKANRLNRVLIVITTLVGILAAVIDFLANYDAVISALSRIFE